MHTLSSLYNVAAGLVLIAGLAACVDENNTLGKNLVDSAFRNVFTDTCTVTASTFRFDSLETSGKKVAWVGRYTHPLWGTHTASSYVAYTLPAYGTDKEQTVVFDSLTVSLIYRPYFAGDTTQPHKIDVYRLAEKLQLNDNGYLYAHSGFRYEAEVLGSRTFKPRPRSGGTLEIRLSDAFGHDLLTRFHNRDDQVTSDFFPDYFKGLVFVPDTTVCRSLLSFQAADSSATLHLYYHIKNSSKEQQVLTFYPTVAPQFNRVEHDCSGTPLAGYPGKNTELPSASTGGRALVCALSGWYSRLDFPYLNNLMQEGDAVEIEDAWLRIYPETGTYSPYNPLPDSLYLYIADENNVVTDVVQDNLGNEVQVGYLVADGSYGGNTYYSFDLTTFLAGELGAFGMNKHNLQLVFSSSGYTKTFSNLTFGDRNSRYPLQLRITYKIYERN